MSPERRADERTARLAEEVEAELVRLADVADSITRLRPEMGTSADDISRMALAGYLHGFYTGCEVTLSRIIRAFESVPAGKSWHHELLALCAAPVEGVRPPIITVRTAELLGRLLDFRHFFRVHYATELEPSKLQGNATLVPAALAGMRDDVRRFLAMLRTTEQT